MIDDSARVAVAVSGGPDSVALLLALVRASERGLLPRPAGVLHFHHGIRGRDADEDAAFCASLAARFGLPCVIGLGAVPKRGAAYSNADARRLRYAFLEESAREIGATVLATAHTKNDQAETVLWRVLRGTGLNGLSGIPASRVINPDLRVVRPLLNETREAVEAFCRSENVTPRRDPTNDNRQFTRVRVRKLLPELANHFNPRLLDALSRLAAQAARDADLLNTLADTLWADTHEENPPGEIEGESIVRLRVAPLQTAHAALRFRVLLRALRRVCAGTPEADEAATDAFVRRLDNLLHQKNGAVDLPGKRRAWRDGDLLILAPANALATPSPTADALYQARLFVPGSVDMPEVGSGLRVSARLRDTGEPAAVRVRHAQTVDCAVPNQAENAPAETAPLIVRNARLGDRIAPLGMNGQTRLVRDVLADAKIPASERAAHPLVVRSDTGAVLWVVGIAQAEETRVIEPVAQAWILRLGVEPLSQ